VPAGAQRGQVASSEAFNEHFKPPASSEAINLHASTHGVANSPSFLI